MAVSRCKLPPLPIPSIKIAVPGIVVPSLPTISIAFKCPLDAIWPPE